MRSINEALASLVGRESMAVPGRFAPPGPPPPDNLLDPLSMGVPRCAPELDDEFPLENLAELNDDMEALREACITTINAFQETRETVSVLRSDLLDRIIPLETRVPAVHTLVSLEDLEDYPEVGQGTVNRLRDVVNDLTARVTQLEVAQAKHATL